MGKPKVQFIVGVTSSFILAFAWFVILVASADWLSLKTQTFSFDVNLFSVYIEGGTLKEVGQFASCGVGLSSVCNYLGKLEGKSIWVSEAQQEFCNVNFACDDWKNLWIATWITMVFGFFAVIAFLTGGISLAYYTFVHATETGRKTTNVFLVLAPIACALAVGGFMLLTMSWGTSSTFGLLNVGLSTPRPHYGRGFIFACFFTLLSVIPTMIMALCGKEDPMEKKHGEDMEEVGQLYGGYPGYPNQGQYPGQYPVGQYPGQGGMPGHHGSTGQAWGAHLHANGRQVEMQRGTWGAGVPPPSSGGYAQQGGYGAGPGWRQ